MLMVYFMTLVCTLSSETQRELPAGEPKTSQGASVLRNWIEENGDCGGSTDLLVSFPDHPQYEMGSVNET